MIEGRASDQRHVIPRWLTLKQAQRLGEFDTTKPSVTSQGYALNVERIRKRLIENFESEQEAWVKTGGVAEAEELLTSAIVLDRRDDPAVISAAISVASNLSAGSALVEFSEEIVHGRRQEATTGSIASVAELRSEVSIRKRLLSLNPRDGLLTAETALFHLNLGQHKAAWSLLQRALHINPNNRYVLRAAARFWCHRGEPDRAAAILHASPRTKSDPWLVAAELATEALMGTSPTRWRSAKDIVRSGSFSSRSLSELACQLGTFELRDGSRKQGINLLRIGADSPTENAIAQIEFVGRETALFEPDDIVSNTQEAFEALAHKHYWKFQWDEALRACEEWHAIEPFSTRPAIFGSFVASVRSTSLERGLALAMSSHIANPTDPLLLNNLAVIHTYLGNMEQARRSLDMSKQFSDTDLTVTLMASEGLVRFRSGEFEEGLALYEAAISEAVKTKQLESALRAYCFLGREMTRVNSDWGRTFGAEIDKVVEKLRRRGVSIPRDVEIIREQYLESKPQLFDAPNLRVPVLSAAID